jgi:aldehyde:ferredoxin oxidoreductase
MLETPLEMGSGRVAELTASRLQAMVDGYYVARGLDVSGCADPHDLGDLLLGPG